MDLSKVKLVVSDMDGTLLNRAGEVSDKFLGQFSELRKRNIKFVAASGRQYQSILDKLNTISNEILVIAENGTLLYDGKEKRVILPLSKDYVLRAISLLRSVQGCYIVLCGEKSAYIENSDESFLKEFEKYYSKYTIVEDLAKVDNDDFLKIAIYHFECAETCVLPALKGLETDGRVTVSGKNWIDVSNIQANKGYALDILQKQLGVKREETMVFGDYQNDLQMLDNAFYSFAMANAHPDVKKSARFRTKSNDELGVEFIISQLLKGELTYK